MERNVFVLSITVFLIDLISSSWYMVIPLYLEELGASTIAIGVSFALISIGWYSLQFPGGLLGDKIGRKILIVLSTTIFLPCYFMLSIARVWWMATLVMTVFWAFSGLQYPSLNSTIAESVAKKDWEIAFATFVFFNNLSWAIGPLIGAFLIPLYGFQLVFYCGVIVSGVCAVIQFLFLQETMQKKSKVEHKISLVTNRNIAYFLTGCSIFGLAYGLVLPLISLYANKLLKLSFFEIELMFSISQFATCISTFPSGLLIRKIGSKRGFIVSTLGACLSIAVWIFSPSFLVAAILLSLFSIFVYSLQDTSYGSLVSNITVPQVRATVLGVAATIIGISNAVGSTIGGYLWEFYGPVFPFLLCGILSFPSTFFLLKVKVLDREHVVEHLIHT
ncbi:MAG: MFS transporter [Candidatus Baldrarchaeia archaeon]|nr:MFS transporter [Candidatus Baldrarchaeota archaeon]